MSRPDKPYLEKPAMSRKQRLALYAATVIVGLVIALVTIRMSAGLVSRVAPPEEPKAPWVLSCPGERFFFTDRPIVTGAPVVSGPARSVIFTTTGRCVLSPVKGGSEE